MTDPDEVEIRAWLNYFGTPAGLAAYVVAMSVLESPEQFDAGCWCVRNLDDPEQIRNRAFAVLRLPTAIQELARWN